VVPHRDHRDGLEDIVIYTTRDTCASRLVQRGIDIHRVKESMGHTNIVTTMRYAYHAPNNLTGAVSVLEGGATVQLNVVQGGRGV
jgi:integrase